MRKTLKDYGQLGLLFAGFLAGIGLVVTCGGGGGGLQGTPSSTSATISFVPLDLGSLGITGDDLDNVNVPPVLRGVTNVQDALNRINVILSPKLSIISEDAINDPLLPPIVTPPSTDGSPAVPLTFSRALNGLVRAGNLSGPLRADNALTLSCDDDSSDDEDKRRVARIFCRDGDTANPAGVFEIIQASTPAGFPALFPSVNENLQNDRVRVRIDGADSSVNLFDSNPGNTSPTISLTGETGVIATSGNINTSSNVNAGGTVSAANVNASNSVNAEDVTGTMQVTAGTGANNVVLDGATGSAALTGDVNAAGDVNAGGDVNATGNVTGTDMNATGNVNAGADVVATGDLNGANVNATGNMTAGGDVTGANLITGGNVTATGALTSASVSTGIVTAVGAVAGGTVTSLGDVSAANDVTATNNVMAGGNVTAGGDVTATGDLNGANVNLSGALTADSGAFTNSVTATNVTASGTVNGGTVSSLGDVNAAGNLAGVDANVTNVNATGDVNAANATITGALAADTFNGVTSVTTGPTGTPAVTLDGATGDVTATGTISTTADATAATNMTAGADPTAAGASIGARIDSTGLATLNSATNAALLVGNGGTVLNVGDQSVDPDGGHSLVRAGEKGGAAPDGTGLLEVLDSTQTVRISADAESGMLTADCVMATGGGMMSTFGSLTADDITVNMTLDVTGVTTLTGALNANGGAAVTGGLTSDTVTASTSVVASGAGTVTMSAATGDVTASGDMNASGNVTAGGNMSATNLTLTGTMNAASLTTTGAVNAGSISTTGALAADSITSTNALSAGSVASTGTVSASDFSTGAITIDGGTTIMNVGANVSVDGSTVGTMSVGAGGAAVLLDGTTGSITTDGDVTVGGMVNATGDVTSGGTIMATVDLASAGAKSFLQPHPYDPSLEIRFNCLEGPENGTYARGVAKLVNGEVVVPVPNSFALASEDDGLTVQVTLMGDCNGVFVPKASLKSDSFVIKELMGGRSNCEVSWVISGIRRGFADFEPIQPNTHFVPKVEGKRMFPMSHPATKMLIDLGILNADGTPNKQMAADMGWELKTSK